MSSFQEREAAFNDGLENVASGLGTSKDKNYYNYWSHSGRNYDYKQLSARYREDWVAQKVCKIIPQDMTREWRRISTKEGQEADRRQRVRDLFREAYKWARVYGTSAILLDLKGTGNPERPLNLRRLKKGCINSLQIVDRTRLYPVGEIIIDPWDPLYGNPTHYTLAGSSQRIHASRVLRFEGTVLTKYEHWQNQWYSDSVLIPLMNTIDNFHTAAQSASSLTQEASADVVTIEGLQQLLTNPDGEQALMKRFRVMKQMKSNHNIILLDKLEEYDTKTIHLQGIKDLIWEYLRVIAAAVGVPATRFLSASPDGMNATGESDMNNYIEFLRGQQAAIFDPRLAIIDRIVQAHYDIPEYTYEWRDLFPESSVQQAEREKKQAEALEILVENNIITAEQAALVLDSRQTYPVLSADKSQPAPNNPLGKPEDKPNDYKSRHVQ